MTTTTTKDNLYFLQDSVEKLSIDKQTPMFVPQAKEKTRTVPPAKEKTPVHSDEV